MNSDKYLKDYGWYGQPHQISFANTLHSEITFNAYV